VEEMMVSMRDAFLSELYSIARDDHDVILISADFGAPTLDQFRSHLASQFLNVGIAEQGMISLAAGLALAGKKVFCYAILPFITLRCLEQIKVDLCSMNLPVTLIGVGAGYAYDDSGPTHHGLEDIGIMRSLPNMTIFNASSNNMARNLAHFTYKTTGPTYIRLDREQGELPVLIQELRTGQAWIRMGDDLNIISTGYMVSRACEVAHELAKSGIAASVIDLYRLKPVELDEEILKRPVVTLEEHFLSGGIGSIVAEVMADNNIKQPLKRFGVPDGYSFKYGGREQLHRECGLDVETITTEIIKWLKRRENGNNFREVK
jgi:transketolase